MKTKALQVNIGLHSWITSRIKPFLHKWSFYIQYHAKIEVRTAEIIWLSFINTW